MKSWLLVIANAFLIGFRVPFWLRKSQQVEPTHNHHLQQSGFKPELLFLTV